MFDDWQKDSEGKATVYPLVAHETFVPHGLLCGLRVHYLKSPADLLEGQSSTLPLVMTVEMARSLAAALARAADEADKGPGGDIRH